VILSHFVYPNDSKSIGGRKKEKDAKITQQSKGLKHVQFVLLGLILEEGEGSAGGRTSARRKDPTRTLSRILANRTASRLYA
jgi:hypothetical protein